ncbi:hypothetical protein METBISCDRAFT_21105 [Metschnikowia bicuspidata]|uniref:tRNA/rRNA methyltransferase SpoU type domain-containing protein n=1 Tax=Metschnikowia bicuspidata TaxID=27322 RepID=A0A4P9ZJW6_9ASCO|nr:hypothetical protein METBISCDRAFT_21105 [Metschnikowia bicuspidata]
MTSVLQYLDKEQLFSVALALVLKIHTSPESLEILCQIVRLLDENQLQDIYPGLASFSLEAVTEGNEACFKHVIALIENVSSLLEEVLSHIDRLLTQEMCKFNFVQNILIQEETSQSVPIESDVILHIFSFLLLLFTTEALNTHDSLTKLDKTISVLLGHKDESVVSECSKLIRWRIPLICAQSLSDDKDAEFYWNLVWQLQRNASSTIHKRNASIMWLRLLSELFLKVQNNPFFQNTVVNQDFYWNFLQEGLGNSSHEQRKFSLSILQYSIKLINSSFTTNCFSWNTSNKSNLLREWSRFTTLFEILGVDTSLHQLQAATNDFLHIMTPQSLIHPSWGFCLLSTGFRAPMDSVRKASAFILMNIKSDGLSSLRYGLPFYEKHFLPYLMLSRHFNVRKVSKDSNTLQCEFGTKFTDFLASIIQNMRDDEESANFVRSTLRVLISRKDIFDAVKIYTTWGIVKGLNGRRVLKFGCDDEYLIKLFDSPTEGQLYHRVVQTLNLQLILCLEATSLMDMVEILLKFANYNGFTIICQNLTLIRERLKEQSYTSEHYRQATQSECSKLLAVVLSHLLCGNVDINDLIGRFGSLVLCKLLESGCTIPPLSDGQITTIQSKISTPASSLTIESLASVDWSAYVDLCSRLSLSPFFKDIRSTLMLPSVLEIATLNHKLCLLKKIIRVAGFRDIQMTVAEVVSWIKSIPNTPEYFQGIDEFYKVRETIVGEFHELLEICVSSSEISLDDVNVLLLSLDESTHPVTCKASCNIAKQLVHKGLLPVEQLTELLKRLLTTAEILDEERFKLEDRDLHRLLIETFLHSLVLEQAVNCIVLAQVISRFSDIILKNAHARRGLLPKLMESLSSFQLQQPDTFELLTFIPDLLFRVATLRQLDISAFSIETIIASLYDSCLAPKSGSNLYKEIYGQQEITYKAILYTILNSFQTDSAARKMLDRCLAVDCPHVAANDIRFNDGNGEFVRCQIAKIIVSVMDLVEPKEFALTYVPRLFEIVENEPSPLVRTYLEWSIAYLLAHSPELLEKTFDSLSVLLNNHELKPVLVTVYERIIFLALQSMTPKEESKQISRLIGLVVPAAATNKAVVRHISMSLAISISEEIQTKKLDVSAELISIVNNMYSSFAATSAFSRFRSGAACLWDVVKDLDLVHISGGLLVELTSCDVDHVTQSEFHEHVGKEHIQRLNHPIGEPRKEQWVGGVTSEGSAFSEQNKKKQSPLQTKGGAWTTVIEKDKKTEISDLARSNLIVVASLVDKPPNLGGICRLCDVLGAGLLTLHDIKVKEHPQFKNVAVTAEHWMPMTEVKQELIASFLGEKKAEGYKLIGLEQTDKSVVLDSKLKFPKKSLILLGREKEGIPGELLAELDLCVEIKQVGVIRSMNIQTASAVIVHAYSSQNC